MLLLLSTRYWEIHQGTTQLLWRAPLSAPSIKTTGGPRAPYNTTRKGNRHQQQHKKTASLLRVNPAFNFCTRGKRKTANGCGSPGRLATLTNHAHSRGSVFPADSRFGRTRHADLISAPLLILELQEQVTPIPLSILELEEHATPIPYRYQRWSRSEKSRRFRVAANSGVGLTNRADSVPLLVPILEFYRFWSWKSCQYVMPTRLPILKLRSAGARVLRTALARWRASPYRFPFCRR